MKVLFYHLMVFQNLRVSFDSLKSALNKSVDLWVGSIENKPVCGLVTISYNQTVEYFYTRGRNKFS